MTSPDIPIASSKKRTRPPTVHLDRLLNFLFALKNKTGVWRKLIFQLFFIAAWIFWTANLYPMDDWKGLIGTFFSKLFAITTVKDLLLSFVLIITFCFKTIFHPEVVQRMIALYVPFWLAHKITAKYLADIFAYDKSIAGRFIRKAAFGLPGVIKNVARIRTSSLAWLGDIPDANTVRMREGIVVEQDQNLSVLLIGGPGYIEVELDSAVLIEGPDGGCRIVGPTVNSGVEVIEGFERIRQGINLRDIIDSQNISARSRDGILVNVKDIQYSYSVYRGEQINKSLKTPYPFDPEAIKRLVYRTVRSISTDKETPTKHDWMTPQPGKNLANIGGELSAFIQTKGLGEFLAAIGDPEITHLENSEKSIGIVSNQVAGLGGNEMPPLTLLEKSAFTPRTLITEIFMEGQVFKNRLRKKGVQMNWLGVGTWDTPAEIIPANHLEAWKISRENYKRSNPEELKRIQEEAKCVELVRLIQTTPIKTYYEYQDKSDEEVIEKLLADYHEILVEARNLFLRDDQEVPKRLVEAVKYLNDLRDVHWVNEG